MSETFKMQSLKARHRDDFECQSCGQHELEEIKDRNRKLGVHHIKARKEFDEGEYPHNLDNLITLCNTCHMTIEANDYDVKEYCGR